MIKLQNIHKSYKVGQHDLQVLKNVNLHISPGEMVAITGSSGSGKSTLLNILGILDNYDRGEYYLNDEQIRNMNEAKAARYRNKMLGFVFQSFNLVTFKNALENVALPLYYKGIGRKKRQKTAMQYLERVGLQDWAEHLPSEMSGGQKQRVAIARALVTQPKVILADEPTGALDSHTSMEIMQLLHEINKEDITILIVTHEHDIAEECHRQVMLIDGMVQNAETNV